MAAEIKAGKADADQTADVIILTVGNVAVFASGSAEVLESFKPIAEKIAVTLEKEPGYIRVVGHTDNQPIRTVRFASNYELSIERARKVADLIREEITKPDRLVVDGKGADMPIASNETPEGRQRNRRVEIILPRED
jgi:type VI secretion system protein ImpK